MSEPKIIMKMEFITSGGGASGYYDYMERSEAVEENDLVKLNESRSPKAIDDYIEQFKKWKKENPDEIIYSEKDKNEDEKDRSNYFSYMDRNKATKIESNVQILNEQIKNKADLRLSTFDQNTNHITLAQKNKNIQKLKIADKNGSNMWSIVLSFSDEMLIENGIVKANGIIDQNILKDRVRNGMREFLLKNKFDDKAFWQANVHLNTDHVHVHIALSETKPTREEKQLKDGNIESKGTFIKKRIRQGKSIFYRNIESDKQRAIELEVLKNIDKNKKQVLRNFKREVNPEYIREQLYSNSENSFIKLVNKLPKEQKLWRYKSNSTQFKEAKKTLDKIISARFEKDQGYKEFLKDINIQSENTQKIYGEKISGNVERAKQQRLVETAGNYILREIKAIQGEHTRPMMKRKQEKNIEEATIKQKYPARRVNNRRQSKREIELIQNVDLSKTNALTNVKKRNSIEYINEMIKPTNRYLNATLATKLYLELPADQKTWKYGNNDSLFRSSQLTLNKIIETELSKTPDYKDFLKEINDQREKDSSIYGSVIAEKLEAFKKGKIKEEFGNHILEQYKKIISENPEELRIEKRGTQEIQEITQMNIKDIIGTKIPENDLKINELMKNRDTVLNRVDQLKATILLNQHNLMKNMVKKVNAKERFSIAELQKNNIVHFLDSNNTVDRNLKSVLQANIKNINEIQKIDMFSLMPVKEKAKYLKELSRNEKKELLKLQVKFLDVYSNDKNDKLLKDPIKSNLIEKSLEEQIDLIRKETLESYNVKHNTELNESAFLKIKNSMTIQLKQQKELLNCKKNIINTDLLTGEAYKQLNLLLKQPKIDKKKLTTISKDLLELNKIKLELNKDKLLKQLRINKNRPSNTLLFTSKYIIEPDYNAEQEDIKKLEDRIKAQKIKHNKNKKLNKNDLNTDLAVKVERALKSIQRGANRKVTSNKKQAQDMEIAMDERQQEIENEMDEREAAVETQKELSLDQQEEREH